MEVDPITIKDIAREAGVSTATVSYVINGTKPVKSERRQRVLDVISRTNYQPNRVAKSLRTKKTNIIGVLVEDILDFPTVGIINGISNTQFAPNQTILREQIIAIVARTLREEMGLYSIPNMNMYLNTYSDRSTLPAWGLEDIALATKFGMVIETDGTFNPTGTMTRGDVAIILYRLFKLLG